MPTTGKVVGLSKWGPSKRRQPSRAAPPQLKVLIDSSNLDQSSSNPTIRPTTNDRRPASQAERQQLLSSLDQQIKASPYYNQNVASSDNHARRQRPTDRHYHLAGQTIRKTSGDDLDSFKSYHSEVDPYKTLTSTAHMINNRKGPVQSRDGQVPDSDDRSANGVSNDNNQGGSQSATNSKNQQQQQEPNSNLLTGPVVNNFDNQLPIGQSNENSHSNQAQVRVRRDDSDDRESDDEDGVWVDDDEDDDNRQQATDVNETAQEPGESDEQIGDDQVGNQLPSPLNKPPGVIGGPHGYELSPNDLMIYG